jgi:nucleotidyltransferase/DNA polymerase involved in DNA repair
MPAFDFRLLVGTDHRPLYDRVVERARARGRRARECTIALRPEDFAALVVAVAESVGAHRFIVNHGESAHARVAEPRLALAERLLTEMMDAQSIDEILPRGRDAVLA